jgi:hypothetical protein
VLAWRDHEPTPQVWGICLGMAPGTERHQPVELEVRAPLSALDDMVDLEGAAGVEDSVGAALMTVICSIRENRTSSMRAGGGSIGRPVLGIGPA